MISRGIEGVFVETGYRVEYHNALDVAEEGDEKEKGNLDIVTRSTQEHSQYGQCSREAESMV